MLQGRVAVNIIYTVPQPSPGQRVPRLMPCQKQRKQILQKNEISVQQILFKLLQFSYVTCVACMELSH